MPSVEHENFTYWFDDTKISKLAFTDLVLKESSIIDDYLHRLDGPAVYNQSLNYSEWWINGQLHNLNGPAITGSLAKIYSVWGICFDSFEEFNEAIDYLNKNDMLSYKLRYTP